MAIQITTQPQNPPHNAYNNSVIEFSVDTGIPTNAIVTVQSENDFTIFPDAQGKFHFNLKSIVVSLINQNRFSDPAPSQLLFHDQSLFLEVEVQLEVFSNEAPQTTTLTLPFLKSAGQLMGHPFQNPELKLLAPYANDVCHLTYFEGHPFDVSIYSNVARQITVKNVLTGMTSALDLQKGVNRLLISDGQNLGFENQMPLQIGVNELEFKVDANTYFTLLLTKIESDCGKLLKWFNPQGGWSYWRFPELSTLNIKSKTIENITADFKNLENTFGNFETTGKETETELQLISQLIDELQYKVLSQILQSPKIYLYNNEPNQAMQPSDFKTVEVKGNAKRSNKNKMAVLQLNVRLPKTYTQTL